MRLMSTIPTVTDSAVIAKKHNVFILVFDISLLLLFTLSIIERQPVRCIIILFSSYA